MSIGGRGGSNLSPHIWPAHFQLSNLEVFIGFLPWFWFRVRNYSPEIKTKDLRKCYLWVTLAEWEHGNLLHCSSTERTSKFTYIGDCRRRIFDFVFIFNLESFNGKQSDNRTLTSMLGLINYFLLFFFFSVDK